MKNKRIVFTVFVLTLMQITKAQTPEPIRSFATELKPVAWYAEQVKAWKAELDKNSKNAFAWYNYYRVTRNLSRLDTTDKRNYEEKGRAERKVVEDMGKAVPESFEYNLCKWMVHGSNMEYLPYLKKAAELGENREEIVSDMINWGELDRDLSKRNKFAQKWYESNLASPGLLNYNYNVIIGLKPNAIILTCGDNDTYPIWQLQSQGIRKDVSVLNLSLLNIDTYRNRIFKELGIPKWDTTKHTGKSINDHNPFYAEIIKHIASNTLKLPVYVALTTGTQYTESVEDKLYLTGLSYEYSDKSIDNLGVLKNNFEHCFALDYLDKHFYKDISAYYAERINQNYIVPMLKLFDHYKESGDKQKQEWIKSKILLLAKHSDNEAQIKTMVE